MIIFVGPKFGHLTPRDSSAKELIIALTRRISVKIALHVPLWLLPEILLEIVFFSLSPSNLIN